MIGHLPSLWSEELLYSALARCFVRKRAKSRRPIAEQALVRTGVAAVVDLPANLDAFLSMLPTGHSLDADTIINCHTLFPYYEAFLPPDRALKLRADLRGRGGRSVHLRIGLMAGRLRPPSFLRYCCGCDARDLDRGRDLCWRRVHQLAGVEVCPRHNMFLTDGIGTERRSRLKQGFVDPVAARPDAPARLLDPNRSDHALFLRLARSTEYLLRRGGKPGDLDPHTLHTRYIKLLCRRNLATGGGRLRMEEIRRLFTARYGVDILSRFQCGLSNGWLDRILRKPRRVQSPLRHLLLWDFLGLEPAALLNDEETSLFGRAPFPCLNPVCPQRGALVIIRYTIKHCHERRAPVAAMPCPVCGYDYRRLGPDTEAHHRWDAPDWIADYGWLWHQRLNVLWADPGTSLREMARILGVDPVTVKRQAAKGGLVFPRPGAWLVTKGRAIYEPKGTRDPLCAARLVVRRKQWLALRADYPLEHRQRLRLRAPAVWTALYRRDRSWLELNSPSPQKPISAKPHVDWAARDESFHREVDTVALKLRAAKKPFARLTFAALAHGLGAAALLQQHPQKLPLTVSKIRSVVENREQFALRRLKAVVAVCCAAGECVPRWRLAKLAGLRPDLCHLVSVRRSLDDAIRITEAMATRPLELRAA